MVNVQVVQVMVDGNYWFGLIMVAIFAECVGPWLTMVGG